jgi:hypothetical protein
MIHPQQTKQKNDECIRDRLNKQSSQSVMFFAAAVVRSENAGPTML